MKTRKAAVAGRFYPGTKKEITEMLDSIYKKERPFIDTKLSKKNIIGGVVPHAGYIFSGYEAIHFFEIIKHSDEIFDTIFIINPNHTGYGEKIALDDNDYWETPMGTVEIDKNFQEFLNLPVSEDAHRYEHSGEVMLPFLQYMLEYEFKIVPITISLQNYQNSHDVAEAIFKANEKLNKKILIVASSDFSHYVEPEKGKLLDSYVLDDITSLNSKKVYDTVLEKNLSVCGYGPIMAIMEYSKMISQKPVAKILKKGNSGDVIPSNEVVDYVSILFYKED